MTSDTTDLSVKLLIVEDDRDFAELIKHQLTYRSGSLLLPSLTIDTTVTLAHTLRRLSEERYDLVLLDLGLPDAKELDALRALSAEHPDVAVVVLTALESNRIVEQALKIGAEDYLVKGAFNTETLERSLRYALDRHTATRQLLDSERRFRALIEKASDMILVLDEERRIRYASPSAADLLGISPQVIVGSRVDGAIHPEDLPELIEFFADLTNTWPEEGVIHEIRIEDDAYGWRRMRATVTDLRHDPAVGGIVVNAVDVTEQRVAEEILQRTQRLESVGLLAGGVAHDFNNLLTAIAAQHALALANLPSDSAARRHITNATRTIEMAGRLTRHLLDYAGRSHRVAEAVDLNRQLREIYELSHSLLSAGVRCRVEADDNVTTVDIDRTQLQQVILNLLINAVDAIGDNKGVITLGSALRTVDANELAGYMMGDTLTPGTYVELSIQDSGAGMDEATLAAAFEPFFTTKQQGHGLGLAAVLGIVRANHGAIRAASQPGEGAHISILLPLGRLPRRPATAAVSERRAMPKGTILVIEDEARLREGMSDILTAVGLRALTAEHGRAGLDIFAANHEEIDAIFLDLRMPVMDGWDALQQLRAIDPDVEILISSAYYDDADFTDLARDQKTTFVSKPFDVDRVISHLAGAVSKRTDSRLWH